MKNNVQVSNVCFNMTLTFKIKYSFILFIFSKKSVYHSVWFLGILFYFNGRHSGLMVSALDSRSNGPGLSLGQGTALCSWERNFTLIVPLSTQVYKWVPANLLLGVTLRWTSIPSGGSRNTRCHFMLRKPG